MMRIFPDPQKSLERPTEHAAGWTWWPALALGLTSFGSGILDFRLLLVQPLFAQEEVQTSQQTHKRGECPLCGRSEWHIHQGG